MSSPILIQLAYLLNSGDLKDSQLLLSKLKEIIFHISLKHHEDKIDFTEQKYAKIISQMIFTKISNIEIMLNGISHKSEYFELNNIIDSSVLANIIRNVFESVCLFNCFFL
jgi:hypothetical protein